MKFTPAQTACFIFSLVMSLLSPFSAHATVTITDVTGVSHWVQAQTTSTTQPGGTGTTTPTTNAQIFGGTANGTGSTGAPTGGDGVNPVNTCLTVTGPNWYTCNTQAVYPTLPLNITLSSTTTDGYPIIEDDNTFSYAAVTNDQWITHPNTVTIQVPWSAICGASTSKDSTCATDFSDQFWIGFGTTENQTPSDYAVVTITVASNLYSGQATNGQSDSCNLAANETGAGACGFSLYPGDGKAYVDLSAPSGFPTSPNTGDYFSNLLFFYNTDSTTPPYPGAGSTNTAPLWLTTSGTTNTPTGGLVQNYVDGLTNNTTYYFVMASQDQAKNVGFYVLQPTDTGHSVTPSLVEGLLPNNLNCFIATAAYGSKFAAKVQMFRRFRDQILQRTHFGQNFIHWYYAHSPYWAHMIAPHPFVRAIVRVGLWPLWAFAYTSIRWGLGYAVSLFLTILVGAGLLLMVLGQIVRAQRSRD